MKLFDLSQPLNQEVLSWPYYPPFEVKYIKRKSEHGVNAQYCDRVRRQCVEKFGEDGMEKLFPEADYQSNR